MIIKATYKKPLYYDAITVISRDGIPYTILGDIVDGIFIPLECKIVIFYHCDCQGII